MNVLERETSRALTVFVIAVVGLALGSQFVPGFISSALDATKDAANVERAEPADRTQPELAVGSSEATAADLEQLLADVDVVSDRLSAEGYDRDCGSAGACTFGQAWSDDHQGPGGRNGCDTRNDVLAAQLEDLEFKDGTNECVVLAGTLNEPYTGETVFFDRSDARQVQIDHVYPLATAWDMGAHDWSSQERIEFANDQTLNLLAVDGSANASKGDRGPGEWMPINRSFACDYVSTYLRVAIAYDLPITRADHDAAEAALPTCATKE